jgi:hypothetical protein
MQKHLYFFACLRKFSAAVDTTPYQDDTWLYIGFAIAAALFFFG